MTLLLKQLVYMIRIFSLLEKIPIDFFSIIKIHGRRAAGRGYSYFHLYMCSMYVFIYLLMSVTPPGQKKHDTDLKFGANTPLWHV